MIVADILRVLKPRMTCKDVQALLPHRKPREVSHGLVELARNGKIIPLGKVAAVGPGYRELNTYAPFCERAAKTVRK